MFPQCHFLQQLFYCTVGLSLYDLKIKDIIAPDRGFFSTRILGPFVQSIVSLTSSLLVKMLTVLVSTISNSKVFLVKKCELLLQMQKLLTFFSAKILAYMPYLMIKV